MPSKIKLAELRKVINIAEETLEDLKAKDVRKIKQWRINRALKKAYDLLNSKDYNQNQVDRVTRIVYRSLEDAVPVFWFYIIGGLLAGAVLFASYETYSFIRVNWDKDHHWPIDDISKIVNVVYKESNIVSLYNLVSVPDSVGLKNPKQEFNISNDSTMMPSSVNYVVHYQVNIVELNRNISKVIDKRYIRYQITHYDANDGTKISEKIGKLSDLHLNPDGSFAMYNGTQARGHRTNFEVVLWIGEDAPNREQGRAYNFAFKVVAVVGAI